jgi:methyl-accepting chemotaxis protein
MLLMIVVLMMPLGGVGWFCYKTLSEDLGEIEQAHALEVSESAHRLLAQLGEQLSSSVITNAKWKDYLLALNAGDMGWIEENINVSPEIIPNVSFVATVDNSGKVLTQAGDIPEFTGSVSDPSLIEKVAGTPDVHGFMLTSRGLAVVAASQITDEQSLEPSTGILVFGRLLDDEAIQGVGGILNAGIAIRTKTGQQLSSDATVTGFQETGASDGGERMTFKTARHGGKRTSLVASGYAGMDGTEIAEMVIAVPAEASGTVRAEMVRMSGIAAVMAVLLILLIAFVLRRRIIVPLVAFEGFLNKVSEGQLSGELPEALSRREDEIGSISRSLQDMTGHLRTIVSGIRSTASVTSAAAAQLTEEADTAADGAQRIAGSMKEVAAGAESQMLGMRRGADVALEILGGMNTISGRSASVAGVAEQASAQASEGNGTVNGAIAQMEKIASFVETSVQEARQLHVKSEHIGRMVEAITDIAYRTNLLALNASIEASRAGEQGRGFAVVASEVRKLALQADRTAGEIGEVAGDVQAGIRAVVQRIDEGQQEVQGGTESVRGAGAAFHAITASIRNMEGELQGIASAGQEIGAQLEELSALIEQTEAISESSADRSRDVSGIAESQLASVRKVAREMGELADRIRELELAANRFR